VRLRARAHDVIDVPLAAMPRLHLVDVTLAAESEAAPAPAGDLDFNLLEPEKPRAASGPELRREAQGRQRRTMLTLHQGIGLATLGLLAATVVVGQLNYMDRFAVGAPGTARFETAHTVLATTTLTGFAATGVLGLLAPVPYDQPRHLDTIAVHKLFMGGATLGMMTELGLGFYTASHEGLEHQRTFAQVHQVIGYSTLGLMAMGASALLFN
jgi:hypothetical protein